MTENKSQIFHNDSLQMFSDKLYGSVISIENLSSTKKAVKINDVKHYGYFFTKGKELYFLDDFSEQDKSVIDVLPIKVLEKSEMDYSKNVFWYVKSYGSVKIPSAKTMSFRVMIDTLSDFKHTKPIHFTLSKIINIAALVNRVNFRIVAKKGFGKDSVINNLKDLIGGVANIYGATFAKLEYCLKHKYLIFNEMGNLKGDDKYNIQQFLLATGAFANSYLKRTRAQDSTSEVYNISKTSLGIIYNPPLDYVEKGQEYFDTMFTKAVANRFIPFYLDGELNDKFDSEFDVEKVVADNDILYKKVISTILWYTDNDVKSKYQMPSTIVFKDDLKRFERSFLKISDYISEYAKDEQEFKELALELWNCYEKFNELNEEAFFRSKGKI